MDTLYVVLGSGVGISALLFYIKYLSDKRRSATQQIKLLTTKVKYQQELINELLKPTTIDDTIDSLRKGEF